MNRNGEFKALFPAYHREDMTLTLDKDGGQDDLARAMYNGLCSVAPQTGLQGWRFLLVAAKLIADDGDIPVWLIDALVRKADLEEQAMSRFESR